MSSIPDDAVSRQNPLDESRDLAPVADPVLLHLTPKTKAYMVEIGQRAQANGMPAIVAAITRLIALGGLRDA